MLYFQILLYSLTLGCAFSQYQWRCSDYNSSNDRHELPIYRDASNMDIAINNASFVTSDHNTTYIFSGFSGLNCSGTVVGVEYCYSGAASRTRPFFIGTTWPVFALSVLHQNESTFSVINVTEVTTSPTNPNGLCVRPFRGINYCCDVIMLEPAMQFHIPVANLAFGITVLNSRAALLGWNSTFSQYTVEQYIKQSSMYLTPGSLFTLMESDKLNETLKLFQLYIRPDPQMSTSSISELSSTPSSLQVFNTPSSLQVSSTPSSLQVSSTPLSLQVSSSPSSLQVSSTSSSLQMSSTTFTSQMTSTQLASQVISIPLMTSEVIRIPPTSQLISILPASQLISTPPASQLISTPTASQLISTLSTSQSLPPTNILPTPLTSDASFIPISQTRNIPTVQLQSTPSIEITPIPNTPSPNGLSSTRPSNTGTLTNSLTTVLQSSAHISIQTTEQDVESVNSFLRTQTGIAVTASVAGGLVVVVIIVCIPVVIVVMKVQKRKKEWTLATCKDSGNSFNNAIYVGDTSVNQTKDGKYGVENPTYDYADVGPHSKSSSIMKKEGAVCSENQYCYVETNQVATESQNIYLDESEDIYTVPPSDIDQLYAHLDGCRTEQMTRSDIKLDQQLGSGQFGEVFKGVWKHSHGRIQVAVKTLKEGSEEEERVKFLQEAAIMSQFKHKNVVTMHGVVTSGEPILLVLEILEKGDLRKYLLSMRVDLGNEVSSELKAEDLLHFCRQVASGMRYLSGKAFVHRDLAARNILVSGDKICKIADFGMSRDLMDETYYISKGGIIPVKWTAPEALHYKKYSTASDVWSYGVVLYEIWSVGHKPFEGISNNKVMEILDSGCRLPPPPGCPRAFYSIMLSCWNLLYEQRPNFASIYDQLSAADSKLLQILEKDKCAVAADAFRLGSDLKCAGNLYKDLQLKYTNAKSDNNDDYYEIT